MLAGAVAALLAGVLFSGLAGAQDARSTFTVNSTADAADVKAGNGVCATAAGECTLRAAIVEANRHAGADTIAFDIAGGGIQTIALTKGLPAVEDQSGPTTIDGYTQPGSSPNTDPLVSNARIRVQVEGLGHDMFGGLTLYSSGNVVRGLSLYKLHMPIRVNGAGATGNRIVGNFIGTDAAGSYHAITRVKNANGVHISGDGADGNVIGGPSPAERNVVSGNANHGIGIYNKPDLNVVVGNVMGLDPSGTARLPNRAHGVDINTGASSNVVGGLSSGERNLISGNLKAGLEISHGGDTVGIPVENRVVGNFVGTDATGERGPAYAANGEHGIHLQDTVKNNVVSHNVVGNAALDGIAIGGPRTSDNRVHDNLVGISPGGAAIPNGKSGIKVSGNAHDQRIGPGNVVANNPIGVKIDNTTGADQNTITRNEIFANAGLGIDVQPIGRANSNDVDDLDTGANEGLNHPVLAAATTVEVSGKACSEAVVPKPCTVEVFLADADPSGRGEGRTFVGSSVTGTDGSFAVAVTGLSAGDRVTATATDARGNTSEFSPNVLVSNAASPTP